MFSVKESVSKEELDAIIQLRYHILRKPWDQPFETASDDLEDKSVNAYITDKSGKVIACARLQENKNQVGQIRYMAVDNNYQGMGLGKLILAFLEESAKKRHFRKIELQARENAVEFYKGRGYKIKEKTFLLWGIIQHYLMEKDLKQKVNM
jgi:predicted GNAT family N-acyltransferase